MTDYGRANSDSSGQFVSGAGDVNGDGFADVLIGTRDASGVLNGKPNAGATYLIYGSDLNSTVTQLGSSVLKRSHGSSGADVMNGAGGNDNLYGEGGADVITGGEGNDLLVVHDLSFKRVNGGNGTDELQFVGSGLTINLTAIPDNRIQISSGSLSPWWQQYLDIVASRSSEHLKFLEHANRLSQHDRQREYWKWLDAAFR